MRLRTPLAVTVAGALLIGGAATGTTLALWHDSRSLSAGTVQSGQIRLTAGDGATTTDIALGDTGALPLPTATEAGDSVRVTPAPELMNATALSNRNLRMNVFIDQVIVAGGLAAADVELAVTATSGTTCSSVPPATSFYTPGVYGLGAWRITTQQLDRQQKVRLCIDVRVPQGSTDAKGKSGSLKFTFRGQQVRP